jgi:rhamnopyranosyl-N-acetylglucosaminyl-diphospho-decaprenol beta-1,3/1,4-galactofuranosyltransferase
MEKILPSEKAAGKRLAVVLVTYNRCADLAITLETLMTMKNDFDHLIVVDNASTDDTPQLLARLQGQLPDKLTIKTTTENLGGAGGFHEGVRIAAKRPVDWIWMSDDDAIPQPGCLREILAHAESTKNIYGSVAVARESRNEELCWPAPVIDAMSHESYEFVKNRQGMLKTQEVMMLPFLGFMISKSKVQEIGLPEKSYFISGDDAEYCIRARKSGAKLIQVKGSVVIHPEIPRYVVKVLGKEFHCLSLLPWRRYYEVRNRMWNARLSAGIAGTILSTMTHMARLVFTLIYERNRSGQPTAYFRGVRDGLFTTPPASDAVRSTL